MKQNRMPKGKKPYTAVYRRPMVTVRESTALERAMDDLLEQCLSRTGEEAEADDGDRLQALRLWIDDVQSLAEDLAWQVKLDQAVGQVRR